MRDRIFDIVSNTISELNEEWENTTLNEIDANTRLFALKGNLDSMGLVTLVSALEDAIYEEFDIEVNLADERAMSQKTSPFRSVRSLVSYIERVIEEDLRCEA